MLEPGTQCENIFIRLDTLRKMKSKIQSRQAFKRQWKRKKDQKMVQRGREKEKKTEDYAYGQF
jgi:hypothetical protein